MSAPAPPGGAGTDARPSALLVVTHLDLGGAEEVAVSLAEGLQARYDLHVFAVQGVAAGPLGEQYARRLQAAGVALYAGTRRAVRRGGLLEAALRLRRLIRTRRPALVHLHTEIPEATFALASSLGPALGGPRLLRTVHNSVLWPAWRRVGGWTERRLGRAQVTAVSDAALEGLWRWQRSLGLAVTAPEHARVIYNGVAPPVRRRREEADGAPRRLLFAGRLTHQKGVDRLPELIERSAGLARPGPVEVQIAGSGDGREALERWLAGYAGPWTVSLTPPIAGLAGQLADYDALLMPSRFEGLGLIAVEALLAGVPVVAFRIPGLGEVFPEDYALAAEPGDLAGFARRLAAVLDDPAGARRALAPVTAWVEGRFARSRMIRDYDDAYARLLAGKAIGPGPESEPA